MKHKRIAAAVTAVAGLTLAGALVAGSAAAQTPPGRWDPGGMMGPAFQATPGPSGAPGGAMMGPGGMGGMAGMMGVMGQMHGMMGAASGAMPGMMGAATTAADQWFIQEMVPHHEDAVVMADLALAQAEHPELKALAQRIKEVQTDEIARMRAWYQAWYGTADVPQGWMDQMHDAMTQALPGRPGPGAGSFGGPAAMHADPASIDGVQPFDKAFIEHMVPHHQMAVMMSTMALRNAEQPELRQLLQSIISDQQAEIQQMLTWYQQWYGGTASRAPVGPMRGPWFLTP
jgi:uncharacterized protein (DUF305 family)